MAYIGAEPVPGQNREVDDISSGFNGNATAFTLQVSSVNVSPESANNILINLGGVLQNPGTDYTIAASTITFTTAPAAGLSFFGIILGAGINTATVADGTITNAKVNTSAAIAGTKISPDFGSQNIVTTGSITGNDLEIDSGTLSVDATNNRVGIGITTPQVLMHLNGSNARLQLTDSTTGTGSGDGVIFGLNGSQDFFINNRESSKNIFFFTEGAERMRILSGGAVVVAGTTAYSDGTFGEAKLQFNSKTGNHVGACSVADTVNSITHVLFKNPNGAIASVGTHNSDFIVLTGNNERLRIDSNGRIGIGTTSPAGKIHVTSAENTATFLAEGEIDNPSYPSYGFSGQNADNGSRGAGMYLPADNTLAFATSGAERFRISGAGVIEIAVGSSALFSRNTGGTNTTAVQFKTSGSQVGKIFFNNTDTFYSTGSSDKTLKKNFENWTETILTSFKNLNPQKFNFLQEENTDAKHKGFIAQDLADKFPEAYPIDPETDKYGFNPSGMVVYLMKAIQELEAKVAALEAA